MLVKAGDLIPVRPEATAIPWTKRKSQVLNHLHRGSVNFETFVYDTNVGDICTLSLYFNPARWSEWDLNHRFGIQPQNCAPNDTAREARANAAAPTAKTHSICPRLLIYPEKAKEDKPNPELYKSLSKFAVVNQHNRANRGTGVSKASSASSGYSSANSRCVSPQFDNFDVPPPSLLTGSNTWSPGATSEMLGKAWGAAIAKMSSEKGPSTMPPPLGPPPPKQETVSSSAYAHLPPGIRYLLENPSPKSGALPPPPLSPLPLSKNALALDLSSDIFQDHASSRRSSGIGSSRNTPCFSTSDADLATDSLCGSEKSALDDVSVALEKFALENGGSVFVNSGSVETLV